MGLLLASELVANLLMFRVCWIRGRLGGGKTLLSVALAEQFLQLGVSNGAIANFPTVLPPHIGREDGTLLDRCVVWDEAHQELDARESLLNRVSQKGVGAYARKMGSIWLFPSVWPVDKRLRSVVVWRSATIPLLNTWVYQWSLELDYDDAGGWFLLVNPSRYFSHYDTSYIPVDDGGIHKRYQRTLHQLTSGAMIPEPERLQDYLGSLELLETMGVLDGVA